MFSFFQKPVGIEIRDQEVVLIQLKHRKADGAVKELLREPLPEGTVQNGEVINIEVLAQALLKLQNAVKSSACAVVLPANRVLMSSISLGVNIDEAVIPHLIQKRLGETLPFESADVEFRFELLKELVNEEKIAIVAAIERKILVSYQMAFRQAKWSDVHFISAGLALAKALPVKMPEHPHALSFFTYGQKALLALSVQNVLFDAREIGLDQGAKLLDFAQQGGALLGLSPQELLVAGDSAQLERFAPWLGQSLSLEPQSVELDWDSELVFALGAAHYQVKPFKKDGICLVSLLD